MRTSTETLIKALRILAVDIQSADGVANAAIAEAADRLEELSQDEIKPNHEPAAWASPNVIPLRGGKDNHSAILTPFKCAANTVPLYTNPLTRKPLNDDEIAQICAECAASAHKWDDLNFARAIEAAHGIGVNP